METRPKIDLTLSAFDKSLEWISKFLLVAMLALTIYTLIKSPTNVPIHFNASGKADRYGNKASILFLAILGIIFYVVLTLLCKIPHLFNYMAKITTENAKQQYTIATRMIRFIKLVLLLLFTLIILFTYLVSIGVANDLGSWFLPFMLVIFLGPTTFLIIQSLNSGNKKPK